jgi:hypothetical protein
MSNINTVDYFRGLPVALNPAATEDIPSGIFEALLLSPSTALKCVAIGRFDTKEARDLIIASFKCTISSVAKFMIVDTIPLLPYKKQA